MEKIFITIVYLILFLLILVVTTGSINEVYSPGLQRNEDRNHSPTIVLVAKPFKAVEGEKIFLDASKSYDTENDLLSFQWKQISPSGSKVLVSNTKSAIATFIAPSVKKDTALLFQLTLKDNHGNSEKEKVVAIVTDDGKTSSESRLDRQKTKQSTRISEYDGNSVVDMNAVNNFRNKNLVVLAGKDLEVTSGKVISLNAKVISPDSSDIKIMWNQIRGTKIQLSSKSVLDPTFVAPVVDKAQVAQLRIQASDGVNSYTDSISITIVPNERRDLTQGRSIIDNPDNDKIKKQGLESKNQTEKGQITISPFSSDSIPPRVIRY